MRYQILACDYDGTLAHHSTVDEATVAALRRLRESGRRLVLVTGRQLPELGEVFPHLDLFERVIAENGALLYTPATKQERPLGEAPPPALIERLQTKGVAPMAVGRVIVATWEPHETEVLGAIRDLGLEWQVIFNKGAVMVLPSGINKASGLAAALRELGLSAHNTVAVGDAENDHHLLGFCECGVAVANAVPSLKEQADWTTGADHGAGVTELIDKLLASDLAELAPRLARHAIPLGHVDGKERGLDPYGANVLLAGESGGGKSSLATGLIERLSGRGYQYCVIDPEGDYGNLDCVSFGRADQPPDIEQVLKLLSEPDENCVVNLYGIPFDDRPRFFAKLFPALLELRARTGRPHWIIVDECHHMFPAANEPADTLLASGLTNIVWITVYPDHVARPVLELIDLVLAVGDAPDKTLRQFAKALDRKAPAKKLPALPKGEAAMWQTRGHAAPERVVTLPAKGERKRHHRKYAIGELSPDLSFYFRGPKGKLNLRAQNLSIFVQSAEGVDDETWLYHLRRGDYSRWFRDVIKDDELAQAAREIETTPQPSAQETRQLVRRHITERYSAPA
jgi:hydroxymethylpyrimidine pyrophosphatase-like HAD family hydrolase